MMQTRAEQAEGKHDQCKQQQSAHLAAAFEASALDELFLIQSGHRVTDRAAC